MEYGLIGEKLVHSFSKTVHNELADYDYTLKEIVKDELDIFFQKKDFRAINVTIPYKQSVIPYLDFIDQNAKSIGAVNTVVNKNGKLYGYNTDFLGLKALIQKENIELKNKKVLILGSGGTSKTARVVAKNLNAKEILTVSRTANKDIIDYKSAISNHNDAEIIINTTPVGMYPNTTNTPIDISVFKNLSGVVDVIYNPINSSLVTKALKYGIKAVGGLYMLVAQAAFAVEKFLETEISQAKIDSVYTKILNTKRNIVLIGMPSCGKSSVGKYLAETLGKTFIDTDCEIVKSQKTEISEIFKKFGEEYFRKLETQTICNIANQQSLVIATGGGAVLNQKNVDVLKQNGIVVFLDRSLENLIATPDRPLSSDKELLKKRYGERYSIYKSSADLIIDADNSISENAESIRKGLGI